MKKHITLKSVIDFVFVGTSLVGAYCVATNDPTLRLIGYILYLISSLASIWLITKSNVSRSMLFVTICFLVINVYGLLKT